MLNLFREADVVMQADWDLVSQQTGGIRKLQQRTLGENGLSGPAMGLGCMTMTAIYGEPDDDRSVATIHRAIELGANYRATSMF